MNVQDCNFIAFYFVTPVVDLIYLQRITIHLTLSDTSVSVVRVEQLAAQNGQLWVPNIKKTFSRYMYVCVYVFIGLKFSHA